MNSLRTLLVRSIPRNSHWSLSTSLRHFSNTALKENKFPEISEDYNLLKVIDEYDTVSHSYGYELQNKLRTRNQQLFQLKRKNKLKEMLTNTDEYHPIIYNLLSAKTGSDITDLLNNINITDHPDQEICEEDIHHIDDKYTNPTIHRIYCKAIRCCADLGEFDVAWNIFEQCKANNIISNELYNTMMWCTMYTGRNEESLKHVFELYAELNQAIIDHTLSIHPRTYSTLMNSCMKVHNYDKALRVLQDIKSYHPDVLKHTRVRTVAMMLLLKTLDIDAAIALLDDAPESEDKVWADFDNYAISQILFTVAQKKVGKLSSMEYVDKAEKVFKKSLSVAVKYGIHIPSKVFNGMISVYANSNDYDSCYVLLQYMIDPKQKHKLFPSPTLSTFEHLLPSLEDHVDNDEKWKKMDDIFVLMNSCNVRRSVLFYRRLFDICGDNIEKGKEYYNKMIAEDEIKPNIKCLRSLFAVGVNHYDKNSPQLQEFTRYIIGQHSEYNITPSQDIKQEWKVATTG